MQFRVQKYNDNDGFMKTLVKAYAVNLAGSAGLITAIVIAVNVFTKKSSPSSDTTETAESPQPVQD